MCTSIGILFVITYLQESPKFLYSKGRFDEARASLIKIAKFNGSEKKDEIQFITFDTEVPKEVRSVAVSGDLPSNMQESVNDTEMETAAETAN
mgnify:CR=1 FL=1